MFVIKPELIVNWLVVVGIDELVTKPELFVNCDVFVGIVGLYF